MNLKRILYFAYIEGKPEAVAYFRRLADDLLREGFQLIGLQPSRIYGENVGYPVHGLPPECINPNFGNNRGQTDLEFPPSFISITAEMESFGDETRIKHSEKLQLSFAHFFSDFLSKQNISSVIIGHQFSGLHHIARKTCESKSIPFLYNHAGTLPGTMSFEPFGQMGESWVCTLKEQFESIPLAQEDYEKADKYLNLVSTSPLQRPGRAHQNSIDKFQELTEAKGKNRTLVFYAGINDYKTGVLPRSYPNSLWHSPGYSGTQAGLTALLSHAVALNLHIVFKPHPSHKKLFSSSASYQHERLTTCPDASIWQLIEQTDLTATICSQVAYESLAKGSPTVLLGRMQLSERKICPSALYKDQIPAAIEDARSQKYQRNSRINFRSHVARCLKAYLFSWDPLVETIAGRGTREAARYIANMLHGASTPFTPEISDPSPATIALQRSYVPIKTHYAKKDFRILSGETSFRTFEEVIQHYLSEHPEKKLIQVGAYDGKTEDPLYEYIKKGLLTGILIEPNPAPFSKLASLHERTPGITCLNLAISPTGREATLHYIPPESKNEYNEMISTLVPSQGRLKEFSSDIHTLSVKTKTLTEVADQHNISPIGLLQIDTEGFDYQVIRSLDFESYRPHIIHFEERHMTDSEKCDCIQFLKRYGYTIFEEPHPGDTTAFLPEYF